jgi:CHAT domain-containing protein
MERELAHLYPMLVEKFFDGVDMLKIDALGRIGDFEGMLEVLEKHPKLETEANPEIFNGQVNIAARLRDAGLADRALKLANLLKATQDDARNEVKLLNLRASIHQRMGDAHAAEADFRAAYERSKGMDAAFAPVLALNVVRALVDQQRFDEARSLLEEVNGKLRDATPIEIISWHWLRAEVALNFDDTSEATAEVMQALTLAEKVRGELRDSEGRIFWQGRLTGLYNLAIHVALAGRDPSLVLDLVERTRARAFLDVIRSGTVAIPESAHSLVESQRQMEERRDALRDLAESLQVAGPGFVDVELVRALERVAPEIKVVRRTSSGRQVLSPAAINGALADVNAGIARLEERIDSARREATATAVGDTLATADIAQLLAEAAGAGTPIALAEYFDVHGVHCCLVMRSGEHVPTLFQLETSSEELDALVEAAPWESEDDAAGWPQALAAVVAPLVGGSREGELLWIVPHGPLHQVPLHAAIVDGKPLLERNPVCYSPSASVLAQCLPRSRGTYSSAIVLGDSLSDLPFARAESDAVAARFGVHAIVGAGATFDAFSDALTAAGEHIDVLHLACHGTFDADEELLSGIQLAGAPGEGPELLTAGRIVDAELPCELVTLSACESGRTRVLAGDEPVGLTRAFLIAGAASVLATLWVTNDLSTRLIIERFYDALLESEVPEGDARRKARALQVAALAVRDQTVDELSAHPDPDVVQLVRAMARDRSLRGDDRPFSSARLWAPFILVGSWK